jgi:hypothetical protein
MPSAQDLMNMLISIHDDLHNDLATIVHGDLVQVKNATDNVHTAVTQVNNTLSNGFGQLVTLGQYTNQALAQNAKQNDTIICILEHISKNTCELLNQSVIQTALQIDIDKNVAALADMFATVNPGAALERERLQALKRQIEQCCPPPKPERPCNYAPCPAPKALGDPPKVGDKPTVPR